MSCRVRWGNMCEMCERSSLSTLRTIRNRVCKINLPSKGTKDEPPTQRPRLENPASSIRLSNVDEPGHWVPATVTEDVEDMWTETDPEVFWQKHVDGHVWKNNLCQEEWDELFSNTCENVTARVCFCRSEFTGLTATRMTRGDEILRHLIPESDWPRFLQATVAEWTELFLRDMFIVRNLETVSEQCQKPSVGGVFLVIVIQIFASLNDLLQHHKHHQSTLSCLLQQSSNQKLPSVVSSPCSCRETGISLIGHRASST